MSRQKSDAKPKKLKSAKSASLAKGSTDATGNTAARGDRVARTAKKSVAKSTAKRAGGRESAAPRQSPTLQKGATAGQTAKSPRLKRTPSYADALAFLENFESQTGGGGDLRQTVDGDALERMQRSLPGIPDDYIAYLREVGWGSFLRCQYTVYRQLMPAAERFGRHVATGLEQRVLCFGDSFSGDVAGFLPDKHWAVVEIGQLDFSIHATGLTFGRFIRERMGLDDADA